MSCTKYEVPAAAGRRDTGLKLMSNAELRFKNEEVGEMYHVQSRVSYIIRNSYRHKSVLALVSRLLLLKNLGTLYLVLGT